MPELFYRARRLRQTKSIRSLSRETTVHSSDLIQPIFLVDGVKKKIAIEEMPGIERLSVDYLASEIDLLKERGVSAVLLFGVPNHKDAQATAAWKEENLVQKAVQAIKQHAPDFTVITDVCLCSYTDHGHCGHLDSQGIVDNDRSIETLANMALSHAYAGVDIVAPSDMMDGRVSAIRALLDKKGFYHLPILSYAAKYASAFYGPFRAAADCTPKTGDRKTYQMDPANIRQAMREVQADIDEGADMIIVKPALAYLDVIHEARKRFDVPVFAYSVSGEYSMVKAAAEKGWVNEAVIVNEMLTAMKRAGADRIITYFAKEFSLLN